MALHRMRGATGVCGTAGSCARQRRLWLYTECEAQQESVARLGAVLTKARLKGQQVGRDLRPQLAAAQSAGQGAVHNDLSKRQVDSVHIGLHREASFITQ